jgi:anthraniloyl-CoA monooxygenase
MADQERRVRVVGGGPAGLFAARLLKRAWPGWEVRLHERLPAEQTFGFGVGLSGRTLSAVEQADPEVAADLVEAAWQFSTAEFRLPQGTAAIPGFHSGVAIGRATLLRILARRAEQAGVKLEPGSAPPWPDARPGAGADADADLVIAADGVGSTLRQELASQFGPDVTEARGNFFWCGSEVPLPGTVFTPVRTKHGVFTMHAYPYERHRSTFVIDASDATLHAAGLADPVFAADSDSDERSLAYLSDAFAGLLGGRPFVGNRSRWTHFRTVRCARWSAGPVVLLGDAAATAHPTIGSGTKLALESAIALVAALQADHDIEPALHAFEQARRPEVERLQALAGRSQLWWDSFEHRLALSPARMAAGFLSRAGAVSLDDLARTGPDLAVAAVADWAGVPIHDVPATRLSDWVLSRPLPGTSFTTRLTKPTGPSLTVGTGDAWGPAGDRILAAAPGPGQVVRLVGGPAPEQVRDRLAVAERLRAEGRIVQVAGPPASRPDLADGLLAGRTDLVCLEPPDA